MQEGLPHSTSGAGIENRKHATQSVAQEYTRHGFDPVHSANAGEAALAEVESADSWHDHYYTGGEWQRPAPVVNAENGLLVKRQELRKELQGLEPGEKKRRLRQEIRELNARIDRRTRAALDSESSDVRLYNYANEFTYGIPDHKASATDEIESEAGRLETFKRRNPDSQVSTIEELDAAYENGEKSGYFEFSRKLDYIFDMLGEQSAVYGKLSEEQKKMNKDILASLHNIEVAFMAIPALEQAMKLARQTREQQESSGAQPASAES